MEQRNQSNREEVERRAYLRYEERGREDGRDQDDWYAAEQDVSGAGPGEESRGRVEESVTGGSSSTGDVDAAVLDSDAVQTSDREPTSSPTAAGSKGSARTRGTGVSAGLPEGER